MALHRYLIILSAIFLLGFTADPTQSRIDQQEREMAKLQKEIDGKYEKYPWLPRKLFVTYGYKGVYSGYIERCLKKVMRSANSNAPKITGVSSNSKVVVTFLIHKSGKVNISANPSNSSDEALINLLRGGTSSCEKFNVKSTVQYDSILVTRTIGYSECTDSNTCGNPLTTQSRGPP